MMAKCSKEIQAEKEAKMRCEEVVAGELDGTAARTPLGRVWADFDWEKEEKRKREVGEEERRAWERAKQMRDKLAEARKEKREGQAAFDGKAGARKGEKRRESRNRWRWPSKEKGNRLAKGGQNMEGQGETNRKLGKESCQQKGWRKTTRSMKEGKRQLKKEDRVSSSCPKPVGNSRKADCRRQ